MNLDGLVTQDKADSGEWFPVELYGKRLDFDLLILGDDSDTVTQFTRNRLKKLRASASKDKNRNGELDDDALDEVFDSGDEAVIIRIAGIRGWKRDRDKKGKIISEAEVPVELNGKELKNDKESYKFLITKIPAIKEFVLGIARDRTNFLSEPSGN